MCSLIEIADKIIETSFKGKVDLAGHPYVDHLRRVMDACPNDSNLKVIALLHDLLEDCPEWNEKSLSCFFPDFVIQSVVALTKKEGQSYEEYIDQVLKDDRAARIKYSDLKDNMNITRLNELTGRDFERLQKYHKAFKVIQKKLCL